MRNIVIYSIIGITVLWAEPSVYGNSGSYSSSSDMANKNRNAIASLREKVSQLKEEMEGLKSVVEGLSISQNKANQKNNTSTNTSKVDSQLIQNLATMIDKISKNYISRDELRKALKNGKISNASHPKNSINTKKDNSLNTASSTALYSRGVRLVKQKKYDMAKLRFDILKKRNYKKASTYFYLGEISYRTKRYSDAIEYYKTSTNANEKASYMDTLLLHAAISLKNIGDIDQANRFFQAVIDGYPNSNSAKVAKKYL